MCRTRPRERLREQFVDAFGFCRSIGFGIPASVFGLIPDVPAKNAIVIGESSDDAFYVGLQFGLVRGVEQLSLSGTLHPSGVMDAGDWRMLRTEVRIGLPAGVEEYEQRPDVVFCCDG